MSDVKRICAYYSRGDHFPRLLDGLRARFPHAELTALVPPGYPVSDELRAKVGNIVLAERSHYSPRELLAVARLLQTIRAGQYDLFVVMFDSPQLMLLSALSGCPERACVDRAGRYLPISGSFIGILSRLVASNLWGRAFFAYLWAIVRIFPVRRN